MQSRERGSTRARCEARGVKMGREEEEGDFVLRTIREGRGVVSWLLIFEVLNVAPRFGKHTQKMNFLRLSIHKFLPNFSWARQQHLPTRHFLQVGVMPATELILANEEEPQEPSYTSLRDLLSTNRHVCINVKPNRDNIQKEDERPAIKNRLVELAIRAYLLPSHTQETPENQSFSRQWARFSRHHSSINLQSHVPCLPSQVLWLDITRAFCSLFKLSHLTPQPVLRL